MAQTTSLAWPNMFQVSRNQVNVLEDSISVVNRSKLLIMTEQTELYNNPTFGVGLKRHLWKYNNDNEKAIIKDRIVEQLRLHEPCAKAEETIIENGLLFTGSSDPSSLPDRMNNCEMTVGIVTTFGSKVDVKDNDE